MPVSRIVEPEFNAYCVNTAQAVDIYTLLAEGAAAGQFTYEVTSYNDGSVVGSRIIFRYTDGTPDKIAFPDYWIIASGDFEVAVYDPPTAQAIYTGADVDLAWAATGTAQMNEDGTVTVTIPQPTSLNGPWTYAAKLDGADAATGEPEVSTVKSDNGLVLGAAVNLTLTNTPAPGDHSVTVTCTSANNKTATSATATFTVPTPGS